MINLIKGHFSSPAFAVIEEVNEGTGAHTGRRADAIAIGVWPSRGLYVHGCEVKTARSDWLRELRDPSKADAIAVYCDFWWLVISDDKVATDEEVPAQWGILVARGGKLHTRRPARQNADCKPITRSFLAALARRIAEQKPTDESVIVAREEAARTDAYDKGYRAGSVDAGIDTHGAKALAKNVEEFERTSGLKIGVGWRGEQIGHAVRLLMELRADYGAVAALSNLARNLREVATGVEGVVQDLGRTVRKAAS